MSEKDKKDMHTGEPVYSSIQYTEEDLESITDPICFRVPIKYKIIYKKMTFSQRKRLRDAIPALIEAMHKGQSQSSSNINININMNINELKNNVNVEVELKSIVSIVERLYKLRDGLPVIQRRLVEELYKKVSTMN